MSAQVCNRGSGSHSKCICHCGNSVNVMMERTGVDLVQIQSVSVGLCLEIQIDDWFA